MFRHLLRVAHSVVRETAKRVLRSPHWRTLEWQWLEGHPLCAACRGAERVQVHHRQPFHLRPELELDPGNLISLCMGKLECHLRIGHGGSFKSYNPNVAGDAAEARSFPARRPLIEKRAKAGRKVA